MSQGFIFYLSRMEEQHMKSQSAMEYLMTYGWAILIIAVVLGALFQLGVFNSTSFAPRVPAGACQVERLDTQISLAGECQGGLPQYVASFNTNNNEYITTPLKYPAGASSAPFAVSVWINEGSGCNYGSKPNLYCGILDADSGTYGWGVMGGGGNIDFWILANVVGTTQDMVFGVPENQWVNIVVTYQQQSGNWIANGYVNGNLESANVIRSPITLPMPFGFYIGQARQSSGMVFNGSISNVQLYNTSLSSNEILALYMEGIGGAPIEVQNIVGWWPLNGNANDYSGNDNNGQEMGGITYTGSYLSGYTTP